VERSAKGAKKATCNACHSATGYVTRAFPFARQHRISQISDTSLQLRQLVRVQIVPAPCGPLPASSPAPLPSKFSSFQPTRSIGAQIYEITDSSQHKYGMQLLQARQWRASLLPQHGSYLQDIGARQPPRNANITPNAGQNPCYSDHDGDPCHHRDKPSKLRQYSGNLNKAANEDEEPLTDELQVAEHRKKHKSRSGKQDKDSSLQGVEGVKQPQELHHDTQRNEEVAEPRKRPRSESFTSGAAKSRRRTSQRCATGTSENCDAVVNGTTKVIA
jgi:hypothetical protein